MGKINVDNMRAQWDGIAILAILCMLAGVLFALGKSTAGEFVLALIAGQALPSAVKVQEPEQ